MNYPTYPNINGPFPDGAGGFYYTDVNGTRYPADAFVRQMGGMQQGPQYPQQQQQQPYAQPYHQPVAPAQPYGGYHQAPPPPLEPVDRASSARESLRYGRKAAQDVQDVWVEEQPAPSRSERRSVQVPANSLVANSLTLPYAEGRVEPKRKLAIYPTHHKIIAMSRPDNTIGEYLVEVNKVNIDQHLVMDATTALDVEDSVRLSHGGGNITRRHVPETYPMMTEEVNGASMGMAMSSARVSCITSGQENVMHRSRIETVVCPLPGLTAEQSERLDNLSFHTLPSDPTLREISEHIADLMDALRELGYAYAYRWFNQRLLRLANHILLFELNSGLELETDIAVDFSELTAALEENDRGIRGRFTERFAFLLRNQFSFETGEFYSTDSRKEDRCIHALVRVMTPTIVSIGHDPEERDLKLLGVCESRLKEGRLYEDMAPNIHKVVEEIMLSILSQSPRRNDAWFILNSIVGYGYEIYVSREGREGWAYYVRPITES